MKTLLKQILKMSLLSISLFSTGNSQCVPFGFEYEYDNPNFPNNCWGYAQVRAFGCDSEYAEDVYAFELNSTFFVRSAGAADPDPENLTGVQVGDIVVWSHDGLMDDYHGHAAYVCSVAVVLVVPEGKNRINVAGQVSDDNLPISQTSVWVDDVPNDDGDARFGSSLAVVNESRVSDAGDKFEGAYRPTPGATYSIKFQNSFGEGYMQVGKEGSIWINRDRLPYETFQPYHALVPARAEDQNYGGSRQIFDDNWKDKDGEDAFESREIDVVVLNESQTYTAQFVTSTQTNVVQFENRSDSVSIGGTIQSRGLTGDLRRNNTVLAHR